MLQLEREEAGDRGEVEGGENLLACIQDSSEPIEEHETSFLFFLLDPPGLTTSIWVGFWQSIMVIWTSSGTSTLVYSELETDVFLSQSSSIMVNAG